MNLNHMFVWIFVFLGLFVIVFAAIPSGFYTFQTGAVNPNLQAKEVADYYSASNITLYKTSWSFDILVNNMAYNTSGLPDGHRIEFWWRTSYAPPYSWIEVRHAYPSWFFGLWLQYNIMQLADAYRPLVAGNDWALNMGYFNKDAILALAQGSNASVFEISDVVVTQNFVVMPYNSSYTLSSSWDDGKLHVLSSYEIDFEAMKPSAWMLLAQVLTFQSPELGVPGFFGDVLNAALSFGIWACIILLIFAAITSVIPTVSGWRGGGGD